MSLTIFRPDKENIDPFVVDIDNEFFSHSHAMLETEYTICSVACDEWEYDKIIHVQKVTCPQCLELIKACKSYKY